ncbi:MAG TPA: AgmX/PglI C-terminal domain-containing protein [Candidatus Binatia bacterium]|nr:AgmX/PglI C-terminal domain-containing protein [Candidatus Binatia bacterium]
MSPFDATELQQSGTVAELIDKEPAGVQNQESSSSAPKQMGGRSAILTVFATAMVAIPMATLLLTGAHRVPHQPIFVENQSRSEKPESAVLAVDTFGFNIRAKNASAPAQEIFEQTAVHHLAKLHRTYSRWANTHDDLMGSLVLKVTVDGTGTVVNVDPLASQVTNASFTNTVMADVRRWKFPKGGLETAEITVPLLFVPKGMDPETVVQWERKVRSAQEAEAPAASERTVKKPAIPTASKEAQQPSPPAPRSDRVSTTRPASVHSPKPKTEAIKPKTQVLLSVKTTRAVAIRENPRFSSKTIHEVDGDTQLSVLEDTGDWLKVKIADAGLIGFVRKEFASPVN